MDSQDMSSRPHYWVVDEGTSTTEDLRHFIGYLGVVKEQRHTTKAGYLAETTTFWLGMRTLQAIPGFEFKLGGLKYPVCQEGDVGLAGPIS